MTDLLVGCGSNRLRRINIGGKTDWSDLVTLDVNDAHKPDIVHDLTVRPLPFEDETFDEIHAYEVLEHLGQQGDWRTWFAEWNEWYRILKPGGVICGTSPWWQSVWAWADPGHTRVLSPEALCFLNQPEYTKQVGDTAMSDYRTVFKGDFDCVLMQMSGEHQFAFALRAIKPSRISI
jgi:SAM-dependent methyltransferase